MERLWLRRIVIHGLCTIMHCLSSAAHSLSHLDWKTCPLFPTFFSTSSEAGPPVNWRATINSWFGSSSRIRDFNVSWTISYNIIAGYKIIISGLFGNSRFWFWSSPGNRENAFSTQQKKLRIESCHWFLLFCKERTNSHSFRRVSQFAVRQGFLKSNIAVRITSALLHEKKKASLRALLRAETRQYLLGVRFLN